MKRLTRRVASIVWPAFLVAAVIWKFGGPVKVYIDKYFNIITIVFMVLLVGGFVLIKYLL